MSPCFCNIHMSYYLSIYIYLLTCLFASLLYLFNPLCFLVLRVLRLSSTYSIKINYAQLSIYFWHRCACCFVNGFFELDPGKSVLAPLNNFKCTVALGYTKSNYTDFNSKPFGKYTPLPIFKCCRQMDE